MKEQLDKEILILYIAWGKTEEFYKLFIDDTVLTFLKR